MIGEQPEDSFVRGCAACCGDDGVGLSRVFIRLPLFFLGFTGRVIFWCASGKVIKGHLSSDCCGSVILTAEYS